LITVRDEDQAEAVKLAQLFSKMGYPILATRGTSEVLVKAGVTGVEVVKKVHEEDDGAEILDYLKEGKIGLVINTPTMGSRESLDDGYVIRRTAVEFFVPVITRMETAKALAQSLEQNGYSVTPRPMVLEDLLKGASLAKYI
jgi:carbamoyl-phosphate synthase large subunit